MTIEEYVNQSLNKLREVNLLLNYVYKEDKFAREIQNDISEIMDTLRYRYFKEEELKWKNMWYIQKTIVQ